MLSLNHCFRGTIPNFLYVCVCVLLFTLTFVTFFMISFLTHRISRIMLFYFQIFESCLISYLHSFMTCLYYGQKINSIRCNFCKALRFITQYAIYSGEYFMFTHGTQYYIYVSVIKHIFTDFFEELLVL